MENVESTTDFSESTAAKAAADRALALSKASDTDTAEIYNNLSRKLAAYARANAAYSYIFAHSYACTGVKPKRWNDIFLDSVVQDAAYWSAEAKSNLTKFYGDLDPKYKAAVDAVWKL